MNNSPSCERASDLIAFLYDEASESEKRDFELHLNNCAACQEEVASFGLVRESVIAWRDEALSGFVSTPLPTTTKKSALAALRQFFDLSPLWLKAATACALVAFCILAALAINRTERGSDGSTAKNPDAIYTQDDVARMVKQALETQKSSNQTALALKEPVAKEQSPKPRRVPAQRQSAQSRRPLTRAEREQLAADLRLLSMDDEVGLNLLGDRINQ
ncbi:MAG TPA: zf-HC2 domain-containing protein [Pyrinomonadaceae bacterium]|nr:zf-HC2 domain-containing protein [Pyrinomonadaceae bacterium]